MNGLGALMPMIELGMREIKNQKKMTQDWKDRIRKEWWESMKYPRKKKKEVRKSLLLDWQIACWGDSQFDFDVDEIGEILGF